MNISQYLLASSYSAFSPVLNVASTCNANGQAVACPPFLDILGPGMLLALVVVCLVLVASLWKIYLKAGYPGWAAIVPIYNLVVMMRIVNRPVWWLLLYLVPIVSIFASIVVTHDTSKAFGKGVGYTLGLILLPFIFYPMLAFGDAVYTKPVRDTDPPPVA